MMGDLIDGHAIWVAWAVVFIAWGMVWFVWHAVAGRIGWVVFHASCILVQVVALALHLTMLVES